MELGEQRDGDNGEQAHDVHDVRHSRRGRKVDATVGGRGLGIWSVYAQTWDAETRTRI